MKRIVLLFIVVFLNNFAFSQNHKFEYGLTPVNFNFPVGKNFQDNFKPSVGFGLYGFYNLTDFVSLGLDGGYIFHFINKDYNSFKIKVMNISPAIKLQHYFNKFKVYMLVGYGLYQWSTTPYNILATQIGGKSLNVGGFKGELGIMFKTAPNWELGAGLTYHYINSIGDIKPARYLTTAIKGSFKI